MPFNISNTNTSNTRLSNCLVQQMQDRNKTRSITLNHPYYNNIQKKKTQRAYGIHVANLPMTSSERLKFCSPIADLYEHFNSDKSIPTFQHQPAVVKKQTVLFLSQPTIPHATNTARLYAY
ncbi:hypothetical protein T4C_2475 [Trichinella pseudospiralis]|uniref:Uncharacterized protein n=1 Tax=Trichinella pseudospiralis TaxID=6337 RepID=A0A0V1FB71_TRIPS|nr:hypothetical protein T4D_3100 [Trichinella pseudospiralis]KRZ28585.1 hypothetical protein T4C_2475 [Trichinella pseudospiralis]